MSVGNIDLDELFEASKEWKELGVSLREYLRNSPDSTRFIDDPELTLNDQIPLLIEQLSVNAAADLLQNKIDNYVNESAWQNKLIDIASHALSLRVANEELGDLEERIAKARVKGAGTLSISTVLIFGLFSIFLNTFQYAVRGRFRIAKRGK